MRKYLALALIGATSFAFACSDGGGSSSNGDPSDADSLTGGLDLSDCPAVPEGVMANQCLTTGDDVGAYRALEEGLCGYDFEPSGFGPGCTQLDQAGDLSDECPTVDFGGGITFEGCCSVAGVCGAMDSFTGLGCTRSPDPSMHIACGG